VRGAPFGKTLFSAVARCSRCASRQSPALTPASYPRRSASVRETRPRLSRVCRRSIGCYEERRASFVRQAALTDDLWGRFFCQAGVGWHGIGTPLARIFVLCTVLRPVLTAQLSPASIDGELACDGIGTALGRFRRRLGGVYMGLPTTAAVADMPVGAPPPFASALEQAPDRTRTSGATAWLEPASSSRSRSVLIFIPKGESPKKRSLNSRYIVVAPRYIVVAHPWLSVRACGRSRRRRLRVPPSTASMRFSYHEQEQSP